MASYAFLFLSSSSLVFYSESLSFSAVSYSSYLLAFSRSRYSISAFSLSISRFFSCLRRSCFSLSSFCARIAAASVDFSFSLAANLAYSRAIAAYFSRLAISLILAANLSLRSVTYFWDADFSSTRRLFSV